MPRSDDLSQSSSSKPHHSVHEKDLRELDERRGRDRDRDRGSQRDASFYRRDTPVNRRDSDRSYRPEQTRRNSSYEVADNQYRTRPSLTSRTSSPRQAPDVRGSTSSRSHDPKTAQLPQNTLNSSSTGMVLPRTDTTRDPRLLARINTAPKASSDSILGVSILNSPRSLLSSESKSTDSAVVNAKPSALQPSTSLTPHLTLPALSAPPEASPQTATEMPAIPVNFDMAPKTTYEVGSRHDIDVDMEGIPQSSAQISQEALGTILADYFDQNDSILLLKSRQDLLLQKAKQNAKDEKKHRETAKHFPAYLEKTIETKRLTEVELTAVNQKLSEHRKIQVDSGLAIAVLINNQIASQFREMRRSMDLAYAQRTSDVSKIEYRALSSRLDDLSTEVKTSTASLRDDLDSQSKRTSHMEEDTKIIPRLNEGLTSLNKRQEHTIEAQKFAQITAGNIIDRVSTLENGHSQMSSHNSKIRAQIDEQGKTIKELGSAKNTQLQLRHADTETAKLSRDEHTSALNLIKYEVEKIQLEINSLRDSFQPASETIKLAATKSELSSVKTAVESLLNRLERLEESPPIEAIQDKTSDPITKEQDDIRAKLQELSVTRDAEIAILRDEVKNCGKEIEDVHNTLSRIRAMQSDEHILLSEKVDHMSLKVDQIQTGLEKTDARSSADLRHVTDYSPNVQQKNNAAKHSENFDRGRPTPPNASPLTQVHNPPQLSAHASPDISIPPVLDQAGHESRLIMLENRMAVGEQIARSSAEAINHHAAMLNAHEHLVHVLNSRYNNISTEPMVRSMVLQMQEMYPFASTAQKEIMFLKEAVNFIKNVPTEYASLNEQVNSLTERVSSLTERVSSLTEQFHSHVKVFARFEESKAEMRAEIISRRDNIHVLFKEGRDKMGSMVEKNHDTLLEILSTVRSELSTKLREDHAEIKQLVNALQGQVLEVRKDLPGQLKELEAKSQQSSQKNHDALEEKVDEMYANMKTVVAEVGDHKNQMMEAIQLRLKEVDEKIDNIRTSRREKHEESSQDSQDNSVQQDGLQIEFISKKVDSLEKDFSTLRQQVEEDISSWEPFAEKLEAIEKSISTSRAELEKQISQHELLCQKVAKLERLLNSQSGPPSRLQSENPSATGSRPKSENSIKSFSKASKLDNRTNTSPQISPVSKINHEAEPSGDELLRRFTGQAPPPNTIEEVKSNYDNEDSEESTLAPLRGSRHTQTITVAEYDAPLSKATRRKRKRLYGSQANNDRSDDESWVPEEKTFGKRKKITRG